MWGHFTKAVRDLRRSFGEGLVGSYRPDLHYMRGPGPKWHAKHAGFLVTPPSAKRTDPALHEMTERHA
jgi:hypothetical protein